MWEWKASAILACVLALAGCGEVPTTAARPGTGKSTGEGEKVTAARLELTSPAFAPGQEIPKKHTGEGEDVSPALAWSAAPDGTREFAVICDDPDAPSPRRPAPEPWVHWVLYGIPAGTTGLAEGETGVGTAGVNSWPAGAPQHARYAGPMPPPGSGAHRYFFKVYALGNALDLAPGATKTVLLAAMKGHVLAEGEIVGTYERK
jgi:Raf kinase inhibitor-like YbhB/YbcL family protein